MRAWLYLIAVGIAGAIVTTPALIVLILMGGSFNDALVAGLGTLMIASAIAVVSMRDIIRCGLAMIVCFLALAGIYVTLGAQRATKILGIFARLDKRDGKPQYLRHIPRIWRYLRRALIHPALGDLKAWYDAHVPLPQ